MAAPTPTNRDAPTGRRLDEGHSTLITFSAAPNVSLWEKTVTPPGVEGGDKVDTTTMHNVDWRTYAARVLKELTSGAFQSAYDPEVIDSILSVLNVEQTVTLTFSNGDQWAFYGYLKSFIPDEISEGEQPTAACEIEPTNTDPSDGSEAGPNFVSAAGTD